MNVNSRCGVPRMRSYVEWLTLLSFLPRVTLRLLQLQRGSEKQHISPTGEISLIRLNRVAHALNPVLHHLGNMLLFL